MIFIDTLPSKLLKLLDNRESLSDYNTNEARFAEEIEAGDQGLVTRDRVVSHKEYKTID